MVVVVCVNSATRLGNFGNFLAINFITKLAQVIGDFLAVVKSQTGEATFWATFGITWATFCFNIWSHCMHTRLLLCCSEFESC